MATGAPLHGPSDATDTRFGAMSSPGTHKARLSALARTIAARKQPKMKKMYGSPKPAGLLTRHKTGYTITKGADGLRYMFLITTNSYRDRENETITTKALKAYVDQAWDSGEVSQPFLYWHESDLPPIGDVVWADMEGPFLIEVAKERNTQFASKVWDYVETHPNLKWGASHGFEYPESEKEVDGTYKQIRKFETSLLPLKAAANPYTLSTVIGSKGAMNKDSLLEEMLGVPGAATKLRKGVREIKAALDKQGVQHKAAPVADVDEYPDPDEVKTQFKALAESLVAAVLNVLADDMGMAAGPVDGVNPEEEVVEDEEVEEEDTDQVNYDDGGDANGLPVDEQPNNMNGGGTGPSANPNLNKPITKRPGTFNKEIKPVDDNKGFGSKELKLLQQIADGQKAQADKQTKLEETLTDVVEAVKELATIEDRLNALEGNADLRPRAASQDPATRITDKQEIKSAKEQIEELDAFWR